MSCKPCELSKRGVSHASNTSNHTCSDTNGASTVVRSNRRVEDIDTLDATLDSYILIHNLNADGSMSTGLAKVSDILQMAGVNPQTTILENADHGIVLPAVKLAPVYIAEDGTVTKAKANSIDTIATGLVVGVPDKDNLVYQPFGFVTIEDHGLVVGGTYYLSTTVAGAIVATAPVDGKSQPLFKVIDNNTILLTDLKVV